jgi:hypothetical protein
LWITEINKAYYKQPNIAIEIGHMVTTNNQKALNTAYAHCIQPNIGIREIEIDNSYSNISHCTFEHYILHD